MYTCILSGGTVPLFNVFILFDMGLWEDYGRWEFKKIANLLIEGTFELEW